MQQNYSLQFVEQGKIGKTAGLSGNPGYIVGLPLMLGKNSTEADFGAKLVYQNGFVGTGADATGRCIQTA